MKRIVMLLLTLFLLSCSEEPLKENIDMPSTPLLTASSRWGVVNSSYVRVTDKKDRYNKIIAALRKGDIVEVLSRESDRNSQNLSYWLEVRYKDIHGVVPENYIDLYDSKEKAENASALM